MTEKINYNNKSGGHNEYSIGIVSILQDLCTENTHITRIVRANLRAQSEWRLHVAAAVAPADTTTRTPVLHGHRAYWTRAAAFTRKNKQIDNDE